MVESTATTLCGIGITPNPCTHGRNGHFHGTSNFPSGMPWSSPKLWIRPWTHVRFPRLRLILLGFCFGVISALGTATRRRVSEVIRSNGVLDGFGGWGRLGCSGAVPPIARAGVEWLGGAR